MADPPVADASQASEIRERLEGGVIRRVLAVRASRLGDLLMTTPTLHAFRRAHADLHLAVLTNPYSAALLEGNADIDEILIFDGRESDLGSARGRRLARSVRDRFDLLLALRPRSELDSFAREAGIPIVFPREAQSERRDRHVVDQCFDRVAALGLDGRPGALRMTLSPDEIESARTALSLPQDYVHVHPGCDETYRWKLRRGVRRRIWPTEHWIALLRALREEDNIDVVLTSGSDIEGRWTRHIADATGARRAHRPSLRRLACLSRLSRACVTVDTGPLHLATAVGTPLVGIYGPSPVEFTGPWAPSGIAHVLRKDLPCMPCQGRGVRCPRNVCMEEIGVGAVLDRCRAILAKRSDN